jgi:hypothetical protein
MTDPELGETSNDPIRVEHNKDSEGEGEDMTAIIKYPALDEISEKTDNETDIHSSIMRPSFEELKKSYQTVHHSEFEEEEKYSDDESVKEEMLIQNNNDFLRPHNLSPETCSKRSMSNSSN